MSGTFLTIGIVGFMLALFPVIYLTYELAPLIISVFVFLSLLPFEIKLFKDYLNRHVYFYYMAQGRNASMKKSKPEENEINHDPYDPTIA